jgi:Xaa-Pro aminopeptidase
MYSLDADIFAQRRADFIDRIGEDAVAIFTASPHQTRSKDTRFPYRPSSDILYLTGFREPETVVVLAPGHEDGDFFMFVRPRDEDAERWDGRRPGPEGACQVWGADEAWPVDDIDDTLPDLLAGRETLYYTLGDDADFDTKVTRWLNDLRHRRGKPPAAPQKLVDARDVIHEMRLRKRPAELDLMRRAADISAQAHTLAMKHCRPGINEYELQAIIEYHFQRHGAEFPAYPSIVGSGDNATILHYNENRDTIEPDDLILIDAGCELEFYAGDITRCFPASGEFSPAQRDVYQAVLEIQQAALDEAEPGMTLDDLQTNCERRTTEALIDLGLLEGSVDELLEEEAFKQYFPHKIGHWLGIDVHDVGPYREMDGSWRAFEKGMALTVEPGIYIPEADESAPDELRGIGVRIEDDIVFTDNGHENLTDHCPKSIDAIEDIVGTEDIDAVLPVT